MALFVPSVLTSEQDFTVTLIIFEGVMKSSICIRCFLLRFAGRELLRECSHVNSRVALVFKPDNETCLSVKRYIVHVIYLYS